MPPSEISHYRILRKLGAGGMGEVFLAEDSTLGRKVAIKMLSERWAGSDQARQRLINEAKAAAALDHPNICSIHEVGEEDDRVFIVMPYIEGQSLAERIRKHALPPGVTPDKLHFMTRHDILEDNCDLMATAARLIRQQPSFTLSVTPVSRTGARGIAVSAASKRPSSKAGQRISRVDVYVNDRPVRSIDARNGVVPSTHVTIGKAGNKPTPVEVGAYDHAGRLVAFRRTAVR